VRGPPTVSPHLSLLTVPSHLSPLTPHLSLSPPVTFPAVEVQIFGLKKSPETRAALRFFAERRVRTHFVDLAEKPASPGELRRFVQKYGAEALLDRASKRFAELGLGAALYGDEKWIEKLADEPKLLKMPLVRWQQQLTIGAAEHTWKEWVASA